MTEIPLPRIAGQGTVCVISTRGQARKARVEKFELDEGFPTVSSPLPKTGAARGDEADLCAGARRAGDLGIPRTLLEGTV